MDGQQLGEQQSTVPDAQSGQCGGKVDFVFVDVLVQNFWIMLMDMLMDLLMDRQLVYCTLYVRLLVKIPLSDEIL